MVTATAAAYNDFLINEVLPASPRIKAEIMINHRNPADGAAEIRRVGKHPGFVGVYTGLRLYLDNTNRSSLGIGLGAVQEIPILRAAGREAEADSALADALVTPDAIASDLPLHLVELDRGEEYLTLMEGTPGHLWLEAGRAAAAGDLVRASEIYGSMGARFAEAWAGLLAAERGDASRLDAALAYFEEQQASPYVQRCRALMQASA